MEHLIVMSSITYANKAQRILRAAGIRCNIVPTPKDVGSGCGYSLSFFADPDRVTELLNRNGIKYKGIYR